VEGSASPETKEETAHRLGAMTVGALTTFGNFWLHQLEEDDHNKRGLTRTLSESRSEWKALRREKRDHLDNKTGQTEPRGGSWNQSRMPQEHPSEKKKWRSACRPFVMNGLKNAASSVYSCCYATIVRWAVMSDLFLSNDSLNTCSWQRLRVQWEKGVWFRAEEL
jgi:hypothetical protein